MILRSILTTTFLTAALATTPAIFGQTTTSTTRDTFVGPIGVGSTETIQINVVNLAANSSSGTAASCTGTIGFNNTGGTAIGTPAPFTVTAGQIFSASMPFGQLSASASRTEVMGVISMTTTAPSATNPPAPCMLRYSIETYDTSTGVTHAYINGSSTGSPLPIFAGGPGR